MGKREALIRFAALAGAWLVAAAAVGRAIGGIPGEAVFAAAVLLVLLLAWGSFAPNAPLFGRVLQGGHSPARKAAITFEDGPSLEHTPAVLDTLRAHDVRATFFVLGRHVRRHPDIARRIVEEGHELANHGDDHAVLTFAGPTAIAHELRAAEDAVRAATGRPPAPLFRAPEGFRGPFVVPVARRLGYRVVGWTGSVWDTAKPGVERIVARAAQVLRPGAILLLHDGDGSGRGDERSQTVAALPAIVDAARDRGLHLVTVSELAADVRPQRRMAVRAAVIGVAVAAVVVLLLQRFDVKVFADVVTKADPTLVLAALVANLASVAAKSLTWKAAIDAVGDRNGRGRIDVRFADVVPAIFIGFLLNTVLFARLGEVARISVLARRLHARGQAVAASTLVGTVVTEQLVSGVALVGVTLGVAAFVSVPAWALQLLVGLVLVLVAIGAAALAIELWGRVRGTRARVEEDYVERWWHLLGISASAITGGMREGQAIFGRPRLLLWAVATAAASFLAQIVGILWTMEAYDIEEGVGAAGLVFVASTLVGLFPIVPGNLVVFQGATVAVLTLTYGVPASQAVPFSIGLQLIQALLGVGLGSFFLSYEGLSVGQLRSEVERQTAGSSPPPEPVSSPPP
jgi:peptidoglycan/xylan/chitin deacetylase (PgdA/CDA1 family)/uncharacterized membrane protein YbhN (UPF0104 family)